MKIQSRNSHIILLVNLKRVNSSFFPSYLSTNWIDCNLFSKAALLLLIDIDLYYIVVCRIRLFKLASKSSSFDCCRWYIFDDNISNNIDNNTSFYFKLNRHCFSYSYCRKKLFV